MIVFTQESRLKLGSKQPIKFGLLAAFSVTIKGWPIAGVDTLYSMKTRPKPQMRFCMKLTNKGKKAWVYYTS